jgi:hypothetical protein
VYTFNQKCLFFYKHLQNTHERNFRKSHQLAELWLQRNAHIRRQKTFDFMEGIPNKKDRKSRA